MTRDPLLPLAAPEAWDGRLPAVLVAPVRDAAARHELLRALAARVLGRAPDAVSVVHSAVRPPRLVRPEGAGLFLSSASRDGVAAVAVAAGPVGIDIERVEDGEPPWHVLHPDEGAHLRALPEAERGRALARLWSVKEAYLKALGTGLDREPASFAVAFGADGAALVQDGRRAVAARTGWTGHRPLYALALVALPRGGT